MRKYLLDTTPLAALLQGRQVAIERLRPLLVADELATSMLVYGEVVEFLQGFPDATQRENDLQTLLRDIPPYNLTYGVMARYAALRRAMRRPYGTGLIGDVDTLIAATALEFKLTLVTSDGDHERVPGLTVMKIDRKSLHT